MQSENMFRRLADRVNSAFSSTTENESYLIDMGFTLEESRIALQCTNGDVSQAANLLLLSSSSSSSSGTATTTNNNTTTVTPSRQNTATYRQPPTTNNNNVDSDLEKALKESLDMHNKKEQYNKEIIDLTATTSSSKKKKSNNQQRHLPPKLQDKTKEEQIKRSVSRMQSHPRAVDTLLIALTAIKDDPSNQKYLTIDTSTQGYKDTLLNIPGVQDLLHCCKFYPVMDQKVQKLKLDRYNIDFALLWLAISTLQNATLSKEYKSSKQRINFHKTLSQMLEHNIYNPGNNDGAKFLSPEPDSTQNSALIQLQFTDTIVHKRRFHPDDTLNDIIIWIGTLASPIPDKITSNEWALVDNSFSPPKPTLPMNNIMFRKTLQTLGWWPGVKLQILMKDMVINNSNEQFCNGRGLGIASS